MRTTTTDHLPSTFTASSLHENVLEDAALTVFEAKTDKGIIRAFSGQRKALREHEQQITRIWYREEEETLELVLASQVKAIREQMNHWLQQGGFKLRRQTALVAIEEIREMEASVIAYLTDTYARACALKAKADSFAAMPSIQARFHGMIEKLLDDSERFVGDLVSNFQDMLREKV